MAQATDNGKPKRLYAEFSKFEKFRAWAIVVCMVAAGAWVAWSAKKAEVQNTANPQADSVQDQKPESGNGAAKSKPLLTGDPSIDNRCSISECFAGTAVKTFAEKSDPYYACPTKELSEYTNFVIGMVSASMQMTGRIPNISPITGDPEWSGGSKLILENLRNGAGVATFDQAIALCANGKNGIKVKVMNLPADSLVMWVHDPKRNISFWMPKSHADKL